MYLTSGALKKLKDADIRTLMVTGDNLLTALSVAQDSGMIGALDDVILAETRLPGDGSDVDKPTLVFKYCDGYSPTFNSTDALVFNKIRINLN